MDTPENQLTPDQTQPTAGASPTGTPPAQAPSGVGSAITGQPAGQPTTGQPTAQPNAAPATQAQPNAQPQTPKASPNARHLNTYDTILRMITPPAPQYVDPQGNIQSVPQTRGSLGRTVLARSG